MSREKEHFYFSDKNETHERFRFRSLLLYPLALMLIFEEWGWNFLSAQLDKLEKILSWKKVERTLRNSSPWVSVIALSVPFFLLLPLKFLGLYLFHINKGVLGTLLIVSSKIFGTAFFSKMFQLSRPNLLHFKRFAYWYPRWKKWKDKIIRKLRYTYIWKMAHQIRIEFKKIIFH